MIKLTKLQLKVLNKLDLENSLLWDAGKYGWKFSFLGEDIYVRASTVRPLVKKELVVVEAHDWIPCTITISSKGKEYIKELRRKENVQITNAIIARVPEGLRNPKPKYLKVG